MPRRRTHNGTPLAQPVLFGEGESWVSRDQQPVDISFPVVDIAPCHAVKRRRIEWHGMAAEIVRATTNHRVDYRFHSPMHLLAAYEQGVRRGESIPVKAMALSCYSYVLSTIILCWLISRIVQGIPPMP
jgi:hypothetical protein